MIAELLFDVVEFVGMFVELVESEVIGMVVEEVDKGMLLSCSFNRLTKFSCLFLYSGSAKTSEKAS